MSQTSETATRIFGQIWIGPPDLSSPLRLEWQFVAVRWLGIAMLIPGALLANMPGANWIAVAGVVVAAIVYNAAIPWLIRRRPGVIANGYVTSIGDLTLNVAMMVSLGNGFTSPFALFLFVVTMAIAMRYGYKQSLAAAGIFVTANAIEYLIGTTPVDDTFVFRSLFLVLTAILASCLKLQADRANAEVHTAYVELSEAHRQLLSVDEMKTNFVANVSHELRTPLTSIRSYSEMLLTYDDAPEVRQEFLEIILTESQRLTRLIDDVLDIAKIEAGKIPWKILRLDLGDILNQTARQYAPLATEQNLWFSLDLEAKLPEVDGDQDRLEQVFDNLLSNALKFTTHGSITLRARAIGREVHVSIIDTGVGISPADQALIFEKFQQVGQTLKNKPHGTGLGLAICREIVTHLGGRIWVTSRPGAGSTFNVALPVASSHSSVRAR